MHCNLQCVAYTSTTLHFALSAAQFTIRLHYVSLIASQFTIYYYKVLDEVVVESKRMVFSDDK